MTTISTIYDQAREAITSLEKLAVLKNEIDSSVSQVQTIIKQILPKLEILEQSVAEIQNIINEKPPTFQKSKYLTRNILNILIVEGPLTSNDIFNSLVRHECLTLNDKRKMWYALVRLQKRKKIRRENSLKSRFTKYILI